MVCILFLSLLLGMISCRKESNDFETRYLLFKVDGSGNIEGFIDKNTSTDYFPKGQTAALLSLFKDSVYIHPNNAQWNEDTRQISLIYPNGSEAKVGIQSKENYLRFELLSLEPRNGVEAIVWGPYPTTIGQMIGETVCVVRNADYSIGLQSLEINTIEGVPETGDDAGGGQFIEPLPGQELHDSLKDRKGERVHINVNQAGDLPNYVRQYRGSAAIKRPYGSELRLFSRDRREPRVIGEGMDIQYVQPVEVDFTGSAIALFGCPEPNTLDVIEKIELAEGLPHPEWKGRWIKKSEELNEPYLLAGGDFDRAMEYAKACGFRRIHLGDVFKTWGHFGLKTDRFPDGAEDIRELVERARKEDISLGVHTLTMFLLF